MLKRVKILSDNSVCELFRCLAEHGFSAYVETTEGRYLFDTGRGDVVVRNAEALDVDLTRLNAIIISHGHYDHTGGLELVLGTTGSIDVYGHPAIFDEKWLIKKISRRTLVFLQLERGWKSWGHDSIFLQRRPRFQETHGFPVK